MGVAEEEFLEPPKDVIKNLVIWKFSELEKKIEELAETTYSLLVDQLVVKTKLGALDNLRNKGVKFKSE